MAAGLVILAGVGAALLWTDQHSRAEAHRTVDRLERTGMEPMAPAAGPATAQKLLGGTIAVARIPRLGRNWRMPARAGTGTQILRQGLGIYPSSPAADEVGNIALAGHRATWGAPLFHLDRLRPGDRITVQTASDSFVHRVIDSGVTLPSDRTVIPADQSRPEHRRERPCSRSPPATRSARPDNGSTCPPNSCPKHPPISDRGPGKRFYRSGKSGGPVFGF